MGHQNGPAKPENPPLQIRADVPFQERTWRLQRVGWAVFALLAFAALVGLLGAGPLSSAEAGSAGSGLRIEYERFARVHAATTLVVRADRRLARGDALAILLSGTAVRNFELSSTMPPADGTGVTADGVVLHFRVDRQPGELVVTLHFKPRRMGFAASAIGILDGPAHALRQWIYP